MSTEHDINILVERLSTLYGKQQAKEIVKQNRDNIFGYHGLAWSLGKRDIHFFNMYFLQNVFTGEGKSDLAPVHHKMWDDMRDMYLLNSGDRKVWILPRGTGKSLTGSLPIALWSSLYRYSPYTVVASAVNDTATTFVNNIRNALIDNDRITKAFGNMYDKDLTNSYDRIELSNKTLIQALSSRSTFRGKSYLGNRISLLILDDFQSDDNVTSKEQMDKHWKRFSDDSANAIEKDNYKMVAMGTIIKQGDFYDRLTKLPTWKHTIEKAIQVDDVDELFSEGLWGEFKEILFDRDNDNRLDAAKRFYYENEEDMQYELLWQDYWDCLEIALAYYENPTSFKQEMQLTFDTGQTKKFTNINFSDNIDSPPTVLVIDPATSNKSSADYTAFVAGTMENNITYVKHSEIDRLEFDDYIKRTVEILKEYEDIETVVVEKQTYNGSDVLAMKNVIQRDQELRYRNINFINNHQTKNKDNKIDSIVGDVNMGRVQFDKELEGSAALEQLIDFTSTTSSKHDDYPDALSELILYLKENNLMNDTIQLFDRRMLF